MASRRVQAAESHPARQSNIDDLPAARKHKVLSAIGRLSCGLAGATLGMGLALNGAKYDADIAGIPAQITTNISTERHLRIKGEVVAPESPSTDLGWIEFEDVTKLPLSIDVQLYADAELVESLMGSGAMDRISTLMTDAQQEGRNAAKFFEKKIILGGLIGSTTAELALVAGSRLNRKYQSDSVAKEILKRSARTTGSLLAATTLVGASVAATTSGRDWANTFEMHGESAELAKFSNRADFNKYSDSALGKIISDIEQANACPDSTELERKNPNTIIATTYNIKRGDTLGIDAVAEQLRATNSDVIALQEVTESSLQQLAEQLDMYPIHGWTIEGDDFKYGNAILTKLTMKHAYSYQLPSEDVESRHLLVTVMELPDGEEAVFAATHLTNMSSGMGDDENKSIRQDQANEVAKILNYQYYAKHPIVLMGDMNSTPESSIHETLSNDFIDIPLELNDQHVATSPTTGETIDYIYSKPGRNDDAVDFKPVETALGGKNASDHCSISTLIEYSQDD